MSISTEAKREFFAHESGADEYVLITLSGDGVSTIRLANAGPVRLFETPTDVMYGVQSRGMDFIGIPFRITLPDESVDGNVRATVTIYDVTQEILPALSSLNAALDCKIELVLASQPDVVDLSIDGLIFGGFTSNADAITAEISVESMETEPCPAYLITPPHFPGCF